MYAGFAALDSSLRYHPSSSENTLFNSPTGNKTSWRCRNDVSLYVPATSHVSLKWNTQRRLTGTLPRRLSGTSSRRLIWYVVTTSHGDVMTTSHQYVSTTSQANLKWNTHDVSVIRHEDVSVVCIHDVPLVRLYDVFCSSQMKHPITLLWYFSTMSRSYVVATPCL